LRLFEKNFPAICGKLVRTERMIRIQFGFGCLMGEPHGFPVDACLNESVYKTNLHEIFEANRNFVVNRFKLA